MAARQAQAVSRVGRLRNQLVLAAKRSFPRAFGEAERAVGKRLSEVPDEVLVGYLESFMGSSVTGEVTPGLSDLRAALGEIGIPVPDGVDLREWSDSIRRYGSDAVAVEHTSLKLVDATQHDATPTVANRDLTATTSSDTAGRDDLDDLFGPLSSEIDSSAPEDTTVDNAVSSTGAEDAALVDGEDDHETPLVDSVFDDEPLTDSVFEDTPLTDEGLVEFHVGGAVDSEGVPEVNELSDLFSDADVDDTHESSTLSGHTDVAAEGSGANVEVQQDASNATETNSEPPAPVIVESASAPHDTAAGKEPLPTWASGRTVKPQLFPTSAPRRGTSTKRDRKTIRSRSMPADNLDVPVEHTAAGGVEASFDESTHDTLLAASSVARPVFTSDLDALVGSADIVQAWRQSAQEGGLPVKFILPKPRHRGRGALVVPQPSSTMTPDFRRSWWSQCMDMYRGAKLYELGVFFHRFSEQVVSFENDGGDVVGVRMSLPSGLTGALIIVGHDLDDGGSTRELVVRTLERFLQDRLVHIAVLTTNAEHFDIVSHLIEEESKKRQWRAPMPVTLSRSWEYVEGTGTAVPLLGV